VRAAGESRLPPQPRRPRSARRRSGAGRTGIEPGPGGAGGGLRNRHGLPARWGGMRVRGRRLPGLEPLNFRCLGLTRRVLLCLSHQPPAACCRVTWGPRPVRRFDGCCITYAGDVPFVAHLSTVLSEVPG